MGSGDARAPPHPTRCPCSGRGATTQHRAPAGPTATPRPTEENQHLLKRQKGREAEACVGAGPRSILLAESHARLAQGRRAHACTRSPRTAAAVRVRTRAPARPVRPQPRGSGATRRPGRTRSPRALAASGRSLGEGRRVGAQSRLPQGHRAEAQAFTCAGQGPGGGEGQERQQQPHPAQERRHVQAGGRARRRPPGVPRPGGPGFYSGAATGGSPDSGTRVAAPPLSGASPPRVLSLV